MHAVPMLHLHIIGGKHPDFLRPCQRRWSYRFSKRRANHGNGSATGAGTAGIGMCLVLGQSRWSPSKNQMLHMCQTARRIALRSRRDSAEAKAKLLQYFGCFAGSGTLEDVAAQIAHLEGLQMGSPRELLPGNWTLIGSRA